jgi:hypothetical protein
VNGDNDLVFQPGELATDEEMIADLIEGAGLTEAEAISLLLNGPPVLLGPTGATEPFLAGTHNHAMRARPEQLAKRRAKSKSAKQSRKINRRKK